jgi:hypothetical protein
VLVTDRFEDRDTAPVVAMFTLAAVIVFVWLETAPEFWPITGLHPDGRVKIVAAGVAEVV